MAQFFIGEYVQAPFDKKKPFVASQKTQSFVARLQLRQPLIQLS